jgi:gamma-tubulin complex component 2
VTKKLYGFLLNKASVPYITMLESWIHKGEIRDPYEEFMIVKSRKVNKENIKEDFNDAYWEQRYTIRENFVPSFLVPLKNKILLAGKYLNVIRECGIHLSQADRNASATGQPSASTTYLERNDILAALSGGRLVDTIEDAYQYANKKLLDLLLRDKQLLGRLRYG